jgi:hypothetical protein
MHGFIKEVNGQKIYHWTLGEVYYFADKEGNWLYNDKSLSLVEKMANHYGELRKIGIE